jgi:acetyl-CoA C-acetyltransferase
VGIERAGLEPDKVDQVVFGNVIHTSPEDMYMARVVGIRAGIPKVAPAFTVNRLCGSGVQAIVSAAQATQTGDAEIALAGGAESMSRGAYWVQNGRWGARVGDTALIDAVVGCLTDPFNEVHMGVTAENVAASHGISRDAQDEFALESHRRAQAAIEAGLFDQEVVPIEVKARKETVSSGLMSTSGATLRLRCLRSSSLPSRRTARLRPATPPASATQPPRSWSCPHAWRSN